MSPRSKPAFTLVELLVSMAVLSLLVVLGVQIVGMVSNRWLYGKETSDLFSRARSALDVMAQDIGAAILREDLGAFPPENSIDSGATREAPALLFYASRPGHEYDPATDERVLSLVRYKLDSAGALSREDVPVLWDGSVPLGTPGQPGPLNLSGTEAQILIDGVIQFQITFIDKDGDTRATYDADSRAISIAIVLVGNDRGFPLDAETIARLQEQIYPLAVGTTTGGKTDVLSEQAAASWSRQITNPALQDFPRSIQSSVRVFQRTVMLPIVK